MILYLRYLATRESFRTWKFIYKISRIILDKNKVDKKYAINITIILTSFLLLLWYNVVYTSWISTCIVFPALKLGGKGRGEELRTSDRELHCLFSRKSWYYRNLTPTNHIAYLVRVLPKFCQFLRHFCLLIFAQGCISKEKIEKGRNFHFSFFWGEGGVVRSLLSLMKHF